MELSPGYPLSLPQGLKTEMLSFLFHTSEPFSPQIYSVLLESMHIVSMRSFHSKDSHGTTTCKCEEPLLAFQVCHLLFSSGFPSYSTHNPSFIILSIFHPFFHTSYEHLKEHGLYRDS